MNASTQHDARELEPLELDAVVGGLVVGTYDPGPLISAFLDGFYRTCGCSPGFNAANTG
ncbi:MAG TPA: hypothetical protein VHX16_14575 [Chloroflexota bacterium]|jgi:hypothetical protein|nr:hypothetical protein [Chloroflexota bacterium]